MTVSILHSQPFELKWILKRRSLSCARLVQCGMRCVNTENNRRKYLRPLLFNAKVEENDLGKWEEYIELNFELPDPGPDGAVKELRKMVETRKTPDYKGGKRGSNGKPIPPRDLGDPEYAKVEEL